MEGTEKSISQIKYKTAHLKKWNFNTVFIIRYHVYFKIHILKLLV